MKRTLVHAAVFIILALRASALFAWSDEVSGVLMPMPRGGGGYTSDEARAAMFGPQGSGPVDVDVDADIDVE
jgi:hypothetical protein